MRHYYTVLVLYLFLRFSGFTFTVDMCMPGFIRYKPPFVPNIASPTDIQYFEKEFTREIPELSPEEPDRSTTATGSPGADVSTAQQSNVFQDFTFLDSGALHEEEEEDTGEWNGQVGGW